MTKEELLALCLAWDGSNEGFSAIVYAAIKSNLPGLSYKHMADWLEIMPSTITRWAAGTSIPMSGTMKLFISDLIKKLQADD